LVSGGGINLKEDRIWARFEPRRVGVFRLLPLTLAGARLSG
jgi:hypothetical protein